MLSGLFRAYATSLTARARLRPVGPPSKTWHISALSPPGDPYRAPNVTARGSGTGELTVGSQVTTGTVALDTAEKSFAGDHDSPAEHIASTRATCAAPPSGQRLSQSPTDTGGAESDTTAL